MKKRGLINGTIIVLILLVLGVLFVSFWNDESSSIGDGFCKVDDDCVPKEACHPTNCVLKGQEDSTEGIACTAICEPGTLDCGQGYCSCVDKKCEAVING